MIAAIRVDAGLEIGAGHVMRCLTLADKLRMHGVSCQFITRERTGWAGDYIFERGYFVHALPYLTNDSSTLKETRGDCAPAHQWGLLGGWERDASDVKFILSNLNPDWLIVDHYGINDLWERAVEFQHKNLVVIDDLADRAHVCGILIDQNLGRKASDYDGLLPDLCTRLIGPEYALLRPEFSRLRPESLGRRIPSQLKHILVAMGGVDNDNATAKVLGALAHCEFEQDIKVTAVLGRNAPWVDEVKVLAAAMPYSTTVAVGASNMAELMTEADVAVGAAGGTSWERCCLGLPTVLIVIADNQRSGAAALTESGAAVCIESPAGIMSQLPEMMKALQNSDIRYSMALAAQRVTNGNGAELVASWMLRGSDG